MRRTGGTGKGTPQGPEASPQALLSPGLVLVFLCPRIDLVPSDTHHSLCPGCTGDTRTSLCCPSARLQGEKQEDRRTYCFTSTLPFL